MAEQSSTAGSATPSAAATGATGAGDAGTSAIGSERLAGGPSEREAFLEELGLLDGRKAFETPNSVPSRASTEGATVAKPEGGEEEVDSTGGTSTEQDTTDDDLEEAEETQALAQAPKGVQKRIQKLSAAKKALAAEVESLKAKVDELSKGNTNGTEKANGSTTAGGGPLGDVWSLEDLRSTVANARAMRDLLEAHPDGDVTVMLGKHRYHIPDETSVKDAMRFYRSQIEGAMDRREFLEKHVENREAAAKVAPDLFKADSPEAKERAKRLATPLADQQDHDLFIADALRGRKIREEEARGIKYTRIDPAEVKRLKEQMESGRVDPKKVLPAPPAARKVGALVKPDDGAGDERQRLREKARNGGVSVEDMMDAGTIRSRE